MIRLGLTGSIGMGKSTAARLFAEEGVPVFDADAAGHRPRVTEGALVDENERRFPGTTGPQGVVRGALAERVLAEPEALRTLESLVHPAAGREREAFLAAHRDAPVVVLDIPLLFEARGWSEVDRIAVVSAPADDQRRRVLGRPGQPRGKVARLL